MFLNNLCSKISLWPFLAYLANIKGLCQNGTTTKITTATTTITTTTSATITTTLNTSFMTKLPISTTQLSDIETSSLAVSTKLTSGSTAFPTIQSTTLLPCPAYPLMCLNDGKSPISYCPCIDPRQQKNRLQQHPDLMIFSSLDNKKNSKSRKKRQTCTNNNLYSRKCTLIAQCPVLIEEFYNQLKKSTHTLDFNTFLGQKICDFDGKNFWICCRKRLNQNVAETISVQFQPLSVFEDSAKGQASQSNFLHSLGSMQNQTVANVLQFAPLLDSNRENDLIIPLSSTTNNSLSVHALTESIKFQTLQLNKTGTIITITQQSSEQSIVELKKKCGISKGSINRVVGGVLAKKGSYPWIAALGYRDMNEGKLLAFLCAGSLITLKYIITSAHCINQNLTIARLGAYDLTKAFENTARDYKIKATKIHDNFDRITITNDVALIELTTTAALSDFISTICLPETNYFFTHDFVGLHPFLAGWGANEHQGGVLSILTHVQVPIINQKRCKDNYESKFNFIEFDEKLLCAGSVNADACQGDSGGPLMLPQLQLSNEDKFKCGVSRGPQSRIVGGRESDMGAYPWMAALKYLYLLDWRDPVKYACGGSLITPKHVLTAAHCIADTQKKDTYLKPYLLAVRLGAYDMENLYETSKEYAYISPVCLPNDVKFFNQDFVGRTAIVIGWGRTKYGGLLASILNEAPVPIMCTKKCQANYLFAFKGLKFNEGVMCAGDGSADACQSDSGGPLMLQENVNGTSRFYLVGIVSYGKGCALRDFPGVYTRVVHYMDWINSNIDISI
uniref:Peptidase S1 domain-containing protein n=1 Tax=Glossina brevipalpis TaxID=37001 RepID=A0A1A9WPV0_9MUSC